MPKNNANHRKRAEQRKNNSDKDWKQFREAIEVSYKEQNIGTITIIHDIGTATSNGKCKY